MSKEEIEMKLSSISQRYDRVFYDENGYTQGTGIDVGDFEEAIYDAFQLGLKYCPENREKTEDYHISEKQLKLF